MTIGGRHKAVFLLGLAIGVIFLWFAIRSVNIAELTAALAAANFLFSIPFLLLFGVFYWLKALRWVYLLEPTRVFSTRDLFAPMMIGFAGNNVLPVRLGELLRVYLLGREYGISKTLILATLILERVFDAISLLAMLVFAMLLTKIDSSDLSSALVLLTTATAMAVIAVYVVARPPNWITRIGLGCLNLLPDSASKRLAEKIYQVRDGFRAVKSARQIARVAANSLLQWAVLAACIHLAIIAMGVHIPAVASILVLGLIVAGISIPSAPGFVGTIELCFVIGLGLFGIGASESLAAAIFYHVLAFASVTGTGAMFLGRYHTSFAELRQQAESTNLPGR